jgi:ATP-dependent RNA circularization protein (DNA/RNA ligase family)
VSGSPIPSYPKVYNLGHPALDQLLDGEVVVQEKVDGSQFSFILSAEDGETYCRSKGAPLYEGTADKLFAAAVETARTADLHIGWVYRGEVIAKPKHNTLTYGRVPAGNVILFDVEYEEGRFLSPPELRKEAERIGLEAVPVLLEKFNGTVPGDEVTLEHTRKLLELESCLGGALIEGVVIKNHGRWGKDGKFLAGKHVSEAFKETHSKAWKASNPSKQDVVEHLIEELRQPARWAKAVQHLRERGELTGTPRDIGPLIKEVQTDISAEEREYIAERLLGWALPKVLRGASGGVAEWYKQQLLEAQFEEAS